MLWVGVVAVALAASGTFEKLIGVTIVWILVIDGWAILALFRLRRATPAAPFAVPFYPCVPIAFLGTYGAVFIGTAVAAPRLGLAGLGGRPGALGLRRDRGR